MAPGADPSHDRRPPATVGSGGTTSWPEVLGLVSLVWSCELITARLTFDRVLPLDIAVSALGLAAVTFALFALASRAAGDEGRRRFLVAVVLHLPLIGVLAPLVGNAAKLRGDVTGGAALSLVAIALLAGAAYRARGTGRLGPSHRAVVAAFAAAVGLAALLQAGLDLAQFGKGGFAFQIPTTLPTPGVVVGLLALWSASALFTARPRTLPLAILLTLGVALWPARPVWIPGTPEPRGESRPDIVVISVDTLRADTARDMAAYGRLAAGGVAFSAAQSPSPWTLPSVASLLTGAAPSDHKALRFSDGHISPIDPAVHTVAERLAEAGYATAAIVSPNVFVSRVFGFDRGFASYDHAGERGAFAMPRSTIEPAARPFVPELLRTLSLVGRRPFGGAEDLADRAVALLRHRDARPLFLWVHFLDCHLPYRNAHEVAAPRRLRVALGGGGLNASLRDTAMDLLQTGALGKSEALEFYRNEMRHVDEATLRILDALDADPRRHVVVFTSDHGEEFLDHGGFEHGHTLYQELLHVPLVISGLPGRSPGSVEPVPVGLADVAPTLLSVAGVPVEGRSLDEAAVAQPLVSWNLYYGTANAFAVRDGPWKLIGWPGGPTQLFDLATDPAEARNLARAHPEIVARLDHPPRFDVERPAKLELTPAQREAIRMLGYGDVK